ncbi:S-layer homology domain-containing protein [Nostoc sp. 'Lobaria pulmonaria (5183) cyanobiont']|uniref:S-layer homology domain-containing protein n=1 Tax=Nostoc sp. 'Lobaria pulmonaria (5183) cyanobiont' TaxID=1618022 RepID=UPI000CF32EB9|nr:S-layer homology domain-containing protein [Nostoc sp. 'Lobaria pulmonaria (5183) cyanobiont']AVH70241.1 S-layer domain-containing protein [Nostoc sp. 'Lobaria pulmonaria (5183) cyanobiont']
MLPCKRPAVFLIWAVLLTSLTACANSPVAKNLEESLAADPKLQSDGVVFGESQGNQPQAQQNESAVQLPADFPKDIPLYSNAKLQEVTPASGSENKISTRWLSSDPSNFIASFYRSQFQTNNWQILQQPTDDAGGAFEARRNDLLLKVSIQPKSVTNATPNQPQTATELLIDYVPNSTATPQPTPNTNTNETANAVPQPGNSQFIGPIPATNSAAQPPSTTNNQTIPTAITNKSQVFNDLNKVSQELQQHIQDLAALGVLSIEANTTKSNSTNTTNQFEPGKIVTHREYARWLIAANNAVYANNPAKQIRLASESTQPAFSDVSAKDPDFPAIQGLAEAGLIPSPLSGDTTVVLFRPDAALTREQLLLWKLPLDTRQALPSANLDAVKQTWGFQDAARIDPKALRAVLADYQNSEQSNIRRVFGYTTLFQPKKPVTRAEAATALWYFGSQGEGVSAAEALKLKRS